MAGSFLKPVVLPGDLVIIHSIQDKNKSGMNGLYAVCKGQQDRPDETRFKIRIEGENTTYMLKSKNLFVRLPIPELLAQFRAACEAEMGMDRFSHVKDKVHSDCAVQRIQALRVMFLTICEEFKLADGRHCPLMWAFCSENPRVVNVLALENPAAVEIKCHYTATVFAQLAAEFDAVVNATTKLAPSSWMMPASMCQRYDFMDPEQSRDNGLSPNVTAQLDMIRKILEDPVRAHAGAAAGSGPFMQTIIMNRLPVVQSEDD